MSRGHRFEYALVSAKEGAPMETQERAFSIVYRATQPFVHGDR